MPNWDLQTSQANRGLQVTFIVFPFYFFAVFRLCVFRGWSETRLDADTCFNPDWGYIPNNHRTLGAMLKDASDNENGSMLWHDMIVPRKNLTQLQSKKKKRFRI